MNGIRLQKAPVSTKKWGHRENIFETNFLLIMRKRDRSNNGIQRELTKNTITQPTQSKSHPSTRKYSQNRTGNAKVARSIQSYCADFFRVHMRETQTHTHWHAPKQTITQAYNKHKYRHKAAHTRTYLTKNHLIGVQQLYPPFVSLSWEVTSPFTSFKWRFAYL